LTRYPYRQYRPLATGQPIGGDFWVSAETASSGRLPSVAAGAGGSFVVVWVQDNGATDYEDAMVQRFQNP